MNQFKLIMIGIVITAMLSTIGSIIWYYKWSQAEIEVLRGNNTKLELAVETNEATIVSLKTNAIEVGKSLVKVHAQFAESREEANILRAKLAKHNLGYLAAKKPVLIQRVVNKGTVDANRCLEILSGSPLTEDELAATKKSQANTSCPKLANPNYKAKS